MGIHHLLVLHKEQLEEVQLLPVDMEIWVAAVVELLRLEKIMPVQVEMMEMEEMEQLHILQDHR